MKIAKIQEMVIKQQGMESIVIQRIYIYRIYMVKNIVGKV